MSKRINPSIERTDWVEFAAPACQVVERYLVGSGGAAEATYPYTIRLYPGTKRRLEDLAGELGVRPSILARELLEGGLAQALEAYEEATGAPVPLREPKKGAK